MSKFTKTAPCETHVVTEDRFKILPVTSRSSIKDFVTKHGITFAPGRGFYQLTKPETIQAYKEIVAVRISDGAKVTGDAVRDLLNIPSGAAKFKYTQVDDFEVYVQSTSYNRVLMPDTKFLYEVTSSARGSSPAKSSKVSINETRGAAPPPTAPGAPIDLVFSFDTTGSMYSCLDEVRKNLTTLIDRILKDIPNIRIAVFAHGDYCDHNIYVTKYVNFTRNKEELIDFVTKVEGTSGDDFEECYELVLQEARTKLSWAPGSQRAMVMIGDAIPHSFTDYEWMREKYPSIDSAIDWRKESDKLIALGCRVYAVQCNPGIGYYAKDSARFWQSLAFKTYGHHLELSSFSNVLDFIMAIAYKEQGPEQFEAYRQEVIKRAPGGGGMNADLHALFNSLAGGDDDDDEGAAGAAVESSPPSAADLFSSPATTSVGSKRKAATEAVTAAPKKLKVGTKAGPNKVKRIPIKKTTFAKKTPAKKTPADKTPARKAPAKKAPAKKTPAKKTPVKKTPVKKVPVKKAPAKKTPAKKTPVKKAPAKKAPAKKTPAKKASAKMPAKKTPAEKTPVKGTPAKKTPAKRTPIKKTPAKKSTVKKPPRK